MKSQDTGKIMTDVQKKIVAAMQAEDAAAKAEAKRVRAWEEVAGALKVAAEQAEHMGLPAGTREDIEEEAASSTGLRTKLGTPLQVNDPNNDDIVRSQAYDNASPLAAADAPKEMIG